MSSATDPVAVITDIHGNLPALEAALDRIGPAAAAAVVVPHEDAAAAHPA